MRAFDRIVALPLVFVACALLIGCGKPEPGLLDEGVARKKGVEKLIERFGPKKYSEQVEDLILRDFFNAERGGVFLDVGAGDALQGSNTAFLELDRGWSGVAVDANPVHAAGFQRARPRTRFFAFYVGAEDNASIQFTRNLDNWGISAASKKAAQGSGGAIETIEVPTITLNTLLDREKISRIDFLSMDIEMSEPAALAGFDIRRFRPRLICIEVHPPGVPAIAQYMRENGWAVVERYKVLDFANEWYVPAVSVPSGSGS